MRFSLRTLISVVVVSAIGFRTLTYLAPSAYYKRNHDAATLKRLLASEIQADFTLQEVEEVLGPGIPDDGRCLRLSMSWANQKPSWYPDGVTPDDKFIHYQAVPFGLTQLQFRDGLLVNFNPKAYNRPHVLTKRHEY